MLRFSGAGVSDAGTVREHNEDAAFVGPYVALVADGVGGAAAGEVASATAAYAMVATTLAGPSGAAARDLVAAGLAAAEAHLRAGVLADPGRAGMATTLTCLVCDGERVVVGHLGDSRAYRLRAGRLDRLTTDHTYVQQLVAEGVLTAPETAHHPWRHVVLRSVDSAGPPRALAEAEVVDADARSGDRLLLCSDGLTDVVPDERIAAVLGLTDPHSAAAVLTHSALAAGTRDNVTCVVVDVMDGPRVVGDGVLLGTLRVVDNVADLAAVHVS